MNQHVSADWVPARDATPWIETFIVEPPGLGVALRVSIARPVKPMISQQPDGLNAVLYVTDADYLFGTVVDAARVGSFGGDLAPAVIVGIGYAEETGDLRFVSQRRFLDFYRGPRRSFDAGAYGSFEFGGADAFLAALRDCVMAKVEQHVPDIDPARRVLLGTSAGGHFAAYVLAQDPGLFQGYALMSPMLIDPQSPVDGALVRLPGDGAMVHLIEDLPDGAIPSGLRVFLSAGEREEDPATMFADFSIISNALRMRTALARHGVRTEFVQFAGETHGSVTGAAISRALRFLVPPVNAKPDWQAALAATDDAASQ
ncbi:esterase [Burkholderia lata]|uniref:Esterase n=1 Tax=Burkholderia lata (strain ATCC 17760 / DSM 23089 / LMG 22485 / NCIMB 9086 / R18194 / 383) TaxID=482957 RepID=A0A6P2T5L0_BURL3|nr:alpha/beta hydrolase-fold protein [Burkholderia lata]VWC51112.1 esterase [Burkholderia lata]